MSLQTQIIHVYYNSQDDDEMATLQTCFLLVIISEMLKTVLMF